MTTAAYRWLGHACVLLPGPPRVAVDPWRWRDEDRKADLVLVTHGHADHCSEEDIAAASCATTAVLCPRALCERLETSFPGRVVACDAGEAFEQEGVRILPLPHAGPERARAFHQPGEGLSYLVEVAGARYLFLGDSAALRDHEGLAPDVAFLAVGGLAVMDAAEAADAAARIRPALAVPVHWGDLNGRFDLAAQFATLCAARGVRAEPPRGAIHAG